MKSDPCKIGSQCQGFYQAIVKSRTRRFQHLRPITCPNESRDTAFQPIGWTDIDAGARISLFLCHVERSRDISNYFREYLPLNIRPRVIVSWHRRLEIPRLPSE